ncbi:enkurin [Anolis carolinensis]|uniref:enkurin n=1 Tax=Anolis carolinensis TaxID=28377 RepID=UPI002F2B315A
MASLYMEENIYNLLPVPEEKRPAVKAKPRRYVSIFKPSIKREIEERKTDPCRTMGIPKLQVPTPKDFLRKHSKTPMLPKRQRASGSKRPVEAQVPKCTEPPVMGIQSSKNFISANVAEAIMAVAKKPLRACVDVRKGDKFLIENSGLVIKYRNKKDFGAIPWYIKKWKKEAQVAQEESEAYVKETLRKHGLTKLSKEERQSVLEGLKTNWEEVHKQFQALSVVIDSISKKLRKEKLELQMKQLEEDIKVLEKHKVIYIKNE